jgi:putative peptide zinc metalloprotease protein
MAIRAKTNDADVMTSSSSRPLRLRMRPDITSTRQRYQGREYWILKDPINLKYYRFEDEEYSLLQMLDGNISPDVIKREWDFEFAPQKISMQELYQFIGMLYRSSLLISDAPNQGIELRKRGIKNRSAKRRQSMTNILAVRCRGFDPDRLLTWMNKYTAWFFTTPVFLCVLFLGLSAIGLLFTHFEEFQNKLPSFYSFFAAKNWIWLALVMAATKVIHEFGHGLACKKFGGECHEMGVMMLVLTPCLYVNVSDSWLLKNKWHRAFIAAAGMYVELILSAIAVFVWWFSTPGIINQLALNVIFVSSVTTVLFNANPLLRYDGYYILSDLLEIPNLRQKATSILQRTCGQWFLGIKARPDPFLPARNQWMFITYSIAAAAYRWLITFSIFWFIYRVMEPYGFKVIGQMIALSAIYGLLGMPLIKAYKFFSVPGRFGTVKPVRVAISSAVALALLAMLLLIPIPHFVYCSFYVQPKDAANVYGDVPGTLKAVHAIENQTVEAGQPLISLTSRELGNQISKLQTELALAQTNLDTAQFASSLSSGDAVSAEEAQAAVDTASANLEQRKNDWNRLIVRAPTSGFLLRPARIAKDQSDTGSLASWHGTPLEPRNRGAFLDQQTLVAQIVPDIKKMNAVLAIDQSDIEFVRNDQPVKLLVHQTPGKVYESKTTEISPVKMKSVPQSLSSRFGGPLVTTESANGDEPISTTYMVNVPLEGSELTLLPGCSGVAKIRAGEQTVGRRIWRLVCHTFQFEL